MANNLPMPFHTTITDYLLGHPDFKERLKLYNTQDFAPLQTIIITGIEEYPNDEVIGLFALQRSRAKRNRRTFIQDYLVWHKGTDTFTHYTTQHKGVNDVQHIKEFWKKYGMGKYYGTTPEHPDRGDHWYTSVSDLPPILQEEGARKLKEYSTD